MPSDRPDTPAETEDGRVPNVISCPDCGAVPVSCDGEGACTCPKGHAFWDTNSPEWQTIRKLEAALSRARELEAQRDQATEQVQRVIATAKRAERALRALLDWAEHIEGEGKLRRTEALEQARAACEGDRRETG